MPKYWRNVNLNMVAKTADKTLVDVSASAADYLVLTKHFV